MRHAPGKNRPFAKYCTVVIVCRHGKPAILPAVGAFCFTLLQMPDTYVTEKSLFYIYLKPITKKKIYIAYNKKIYIYIVHVGGINLLFARISDSANSSCRS